MPARSGYLVVKRHGQVERLLLVVVAVDLVDDLDVLVLRLAQLVAEGRDPGVLVGRGGLRGHDRDLTLVAQDLGELDGAETADRIRGRLIDEERPCIDRGIGIEGDDLGADALGALHRGRHGVGIARRDRNRGDAAVGEVVDDRDLRLAARLRRAVVLRGPADLLGGHLRPREGGIIVGVGGLLDHHGQLEVLCADGACRGQHQPG